MQLYIALSIIINVDVDFQYNNVYYVTESRTMYSRPNQNQGEAKLGKYINQKLD